ncbi:transporter substrate-binding domain-containing protein [Pigmentibacter sp. JX0631]|uniref:substrate-binding periplasmic protein n=1 Tax=Pigmentibacter sp. JX0631 TaxID=2976982 RepID=UPI0024689D8B|nr:transporter substrate-binding domain-containing protein [Pigmentibacter sp. JX0631]WGL59262.1 transporter substrate-binding domain-containing protein [Pigmentibacter sp. JX0631]
MKYKIIGIFIIFLILMKDNIYASSENLLTIGRFPSLANANLCEKVLLNIYNQVNIKIKVVALPGRRSVIESTKGNIDGEVCRDFDFGKDYPNLKRIKYPINYIKLSVFSDKKNIEVSPFKSLAKYRIGLIKGVLDLEKLTANFPQLTIVNSVDQLIKMLTENRIDLFITSDLNAKVVINKMGLEKKIYELKPAIIENYPLYHYLQKKHNEKIILIENKLKQMQTSGELQSLIKNYAKEELEKSLIK